MHSKIVFLLITLALAAALVFVFTGNAAAQADDQVTGDTSKLKGKDKDLATKRTVNDSLSNRKLGGEEATGPTKLQMGLGVGSIFVMLAVTKWL